MLAVVAANLVFSCVSEQGTSGGSGGSSSETSLDPSLSPDISSAPGKGFFSDPPAPHDLEVTLDEAAPVSAIIGWEGGTVEANGPEGAVYTLEIPAESLPVAVTITMTPLSDLEGFGMDAAPEHTLGVQLEPEGLRLVVPATLTMTPALALPEAGIATGDYVSQGQDAALYLAKTSETAITFEITHFSGYWSIWPLKMPDWRVFELDRQVALERRIQAMMAQFLMLRRLNEMLGIEVPPLEVVLRNLMQVYDVEEEVLQNRLALAQNGCPEAQLAIQAFLTWDQQLQLMGVAEDEDLYAEFKRPIPPELFALAWNLCLDEEFERCKAIGEWPRLATFLLSHARQRALLGFELTSNEIAEGKDRLERCGHWRVKLDTLMLEGIGGTRNGGEWTSEIDVRWEADGDAMFGLGSLTIGYGEADIVVNAFVDVLNPENPCNCQYGNFQTFRNAQARITGMTFETASEGAEPIATGLRLWVDAGSISFDLIVPGMGNVGHVDDFPWWGAPVLFGGTNFDATIDKDWRFRTRPYRAEFALEKPDYPQLSGIELVVEHTPD